MDIKLKDLIVEKKEDDLAKLEELDNFIDNTKRISLKKFVVELNKIKGVKAEVIDKTHDTPDYRAQSGGKIVGRATLKAIRMSYKGKPIFNYHTKSFYPVGNWSLARNAIIYLKDEIK